VRSIRWESGKGAVLEAQQFLEVSPARGKSDFQLSSSRTAAPSDFASLQYRTDPPVDLSYLHPLQILLLGLPGAARSRVVNPPEALALANEKLEAAWLGDLMPPTVASSSWDAIASFGEREGRAVLKPLHLAQSKGVELLDFRSAAGREQARAVISRASDEFRRPVLLQRYLEGIRDGEQRLWFLDGKLLGYVRKLPKDGDFRVNLDQGSRVVATRLTAAEKKAAARISAALRKRRIRMAAVDLIEAKITDFNLTSPGLITQMEEILGENLARPIVKALAR
ncbi:MAG TPA: hypothetical protein VM598_10640, partial [Bdellovibrionota bacterium]|nr:hypothetical protein [Bdellovibrionota bacterium]